MIIGISGRKESGKGTLSKIIQAVDIYYNQPKSHTTQDTLDTFVWNYVRGGNELSLKTFKNITSKFEIKYFASPVKHIISYITGCPEESLYTHAGKNAKSPITKEDGSYYTFRELLQLFGTEVGRAISPNIWIDTIFNSYNDDCNWIIEDVRFPNELQKIDELNGLTFRCERLDFPVEDHVSEHALDGKLDEFDFVIPYDETLKKTTETVVDIMKLYKMI